MLQIQDQILPEIPDGAHGEHEWQHHGDVDAVVEVVEEGAAVLLEDGLQVLRYEECVYGVPPYLRQADRHIDDLLIVILI